MENQRVFSSGCLSLPELQFNGLFLGSQVSKTITLLSATKTWDQLLCKMTRQYSIRWAFNNQNWQPTEQDILLASSLIQPEEKDRISRFVFLDDAKSSLIGRLMLRKFIQKVTDLSNNDICLIRDSRGKPVLSGFNGKSPFFNVSHQGDYVVLAGDTTNKIGVDIMKIEPPANKNIPEFFRLMTRQFSNKEWETIKSYDTEMKQVASFYRHWCLKESYVKNIGVGITVKLSDISFEIHSELSVEKIVTDSVLVEKNIIKKDWLFEETLLDDKHAVAVATELKEKTDLSPVKFDLVTFEDLVCGAEALFDPDVNFKDCFLRKQIKIISN